VPARPAAARVRIESTPTGATVRRDGEALGKTPLEVGVPRGELLAVRIEKRGYKDHHLSVVVDGDRQFRIALEKHPQPTKPAQPQAPDELTTKL
jgi:hypothetical protein